MKAQAELAIVIGILVVAAILVVLSFQTNILPPSSVPSNILEEQKIAKDIVTSLTRELAVEGLKTMENLGGYLTPQPDGEIYGLQRVPYWQKCEFDLSPELSAVTQNFEAFIKDRGKAQLLEAEKNLKTTSFDEDEYIVKSNFFENKVELQITVPITTKGYTTAEPIQLSIPTNFQRIFKFAKYYVQYAKTFRPIELFAIHSLQLSDLELFGVLEGCGSIHYESREKINAVMNDVIETSLLVEWWKEIPPEKDGQRTYAVQAVSGNVYPDLDPQLALPDEFSFNAKDSLSSRASQYLTTGPGTFAVKQCSETFSFFYSFHYPVVFKIHDSLLGNDFIFITLVYVNNSLLPGSCSQLPEGRSDCSEVADCSASIRITDRNSQPLESVFAVFGGCTLGETNSEGWVEGPVVCGENTLELLHEGYDVYRKTHSSDTINTSISGDYVMRKIPNITMNIYHLWPNCTRSRTDMDMLMKVTDDNEEYIVSNIDPDSINEACLSDPRCNNIDPANVNATLLEQCARLCAANHLNIISVDYIPPGNYTLDVDLLNILDYPPLVGGFIKREFIIGEEDIRIDINTPRFSPRTEIADVLKEINLPQQAMNCGFNVTHFVR